jgi:hypothetical protein
MSRLTRTRVTAGLGFAWLILFVVGGPVLQGRPPSAGTPIADLRAGFADHGTRYLAGDLVAGCGFVLCLLPFAVLLPYAVADRPHPIWSRLCSASAVAFVVSGGVATSFLDAIAIGHGAPALDDSTLTALLYASTAGIALIGLPAAVFATAAAALLWQAGARGVAVLGAVAAPLLVAGAAVTLAGGDGDGFLWAVRFGGFVVLAAFVAATAIRLVTRPAKAAELEATTVTV